MFQQLIKSLAIASIASQAAALDNSLYAEAAPDDAVFVRFLGFDSGAAPEFGGLVPFVEKDRCSAPEPALGSPR